ncbi:MAG TPA: plasmid partitioning protein RepB C-terminal domain-containing protein [bacterium]|nr:plasmid partitioning protein RepB C-terminal domain-containing protein [bacterium]
MGKIGFEMEGKKIPLDRIIPIKQVSSQIRGSTKYRTIKASIQEVGIIEPPVVSRMKKESGEPQRYILLDGHVRIDVLKELGHTEVFCLISTDDEPHTYNYSVNRISPIQEHFMMIRAIENGVSEETIARSLCVDMAFIRQKRNMLDGICPEAVELLKEKMIAPATLRLFKKVKPIRQIEMAEMMNMVGNFSRPYAMALIASTRKDLFLDAEYKKESTGVKPEDIARMEREMEVLEKDIKLVEESYGKNVLNLVLARGYLAKLLDNAKVVRFLSNKYADILDEFQKIVEATSLET